MIEICRENKEKTFKNLTKGNIHAADISYPNLIDDIILKMKEEGHLELLKKSFLDKRRANASIPLELLMLLSVAAKMKIKLSLTDIPFAITDAKTLSELGWNMYDTDNNIEKGLLQEGTIRNFVEKYDELELIKYYNHYVQENIIPKLEIIPDIHILDCSKLTVNLKNENYEKSEVVKINKEVYRGYKIGTLRGLLDDGGIIEDVVFGSLKTHDLKLTKDMILNSKVLKSGDILIEDRGFISRNILNKLKTDKKVDVFIPAKSNMTIHKEAVAIAELENKWQKHPNRKRKNQKIHLVKNIGMFWNEDETEDVELNGCVVYDSLKNKYFTFLTTDLKKTAKEIIKTYELRPEIEEDYRQIKDFWKIEDFKSTKYNMIVFHIVATLIGYLYFQLYKNTEEGSKYSGKSLPVILKNYKSDGDKKIVIYIGENFGLFTFVEFLDIYSSCEEIVKLKLKKILKYI